MHALPQQEGTVAGNVVDAGEEAAVEIAVIDLPHIANFTDFDAFRTERDVRRTSKSAGAPAREPKGESLPYPVLRFASCESTYMHSYFSQPAPRLVLPKAHNQACIRFRRASWIAMARSSTTKSSGAVRRS